VTSRGVPLVARLHVDLRRATSAACPDPVRSRSQC